VVSARHKAEYTADQSDVTVYEAQRGWVVLNLRELWKYRELMFFLSWRDIKVRYKQAVLGAAWVVLQPLIQTVVFTVIISVVFGVKSPDPTIPYSVFALTGLVLWQYFSSSLSRATGGLVGQASLLTKVYFPRLVIPISSMFTGLVDLLISLVIVGVVMAAYGIAPGWQLVFFPLFILLALFTALAAGLWLGALNVLYRDVGSILPFLVQILMYLSPVVIPPTYVQNYQALKIIFALNPMTGALNGFRWAFLKQPFDTTYFWYSLAVIAVLLVGGLIFFKRMERVFADVI
jgi:lipopolysaccharide transport system permease protein